MTRLNSKKRWDWGDVPLKTYVNTVDRANRGMLNPTAAFRHVLRFLTVHLAMMPAINNNLGYVDRLAHRCCLYGLENTTP